MKYKWLTVRFIMLTMLIFAVGSVAQADEKTETIQDIVMRGARLPLQINRTEQETAKAVIEPVRQQLAVPAVQPPKVQETLVPTAIVVPSVVVDNKDANLLTLEAKLASLQQTLDDMTRQADHWQQQVTRIQLLLAKPIPNATAAPAGPAIQTGYSTAP